MILRLTAVLLLLFSTIGSAQEATSLLGRKLYAMADRNGAVAALKKTLESDPRNVPLMLSLSKAEAGKRMYREAVATCSAGLILFPENADLYVERGHRLLGLREFAAGLADLTRAVKIDPKNLDAQYHQGMAYYFLGQFQKAAESFGRALALAKSNDSLIDCSNWMYVALRRSGKSHEAAQLLSRITPDVKNTEPHLYFYLQLLHFYQGVISEKQVLPAKPTDTETELSFNTINYGVGNWHLYNNQPAEAKPYFEKVVTGDAWNSWGFIGSELELARK